MLTQEALLQQCLAKPGAWPDNPWDHERPVIEAGEAPAAETIVAFLGAGTAGVRAGVSREEADEVLAAVVDAYGRLVSRLPREHRPDGWDRP